MIQVGNKKNIIIYGAGECGRQCARVMRENGIKVDRFLDINLCGKVDDIQVTRPTDQVDESKIVVICLANGNMHRSVANELYKIGYKYIICLPLGIEMSDGFRSNATINYNRFVSGDIDGRIFAFEKSDFCYDAYENIKQEIELWDEDEVKTFWINRRIIFSESYESYPGDVNRLPKNKKLFDRPVSLRKPYYALYKFFDGVEDNADTYFEIYRDIPSEEKKKQILLEREKLYILFKHELNKANMSFFEDGAPLVCWNKKGYFNLTGGHHRTAFLIHNGFVSVPVKITKGDYIKWCNFAWLSRYDKINEFLQCSNNCSIVHPLYYNRCFPREAYESRVYDTVLEYLDNYELMSIADVSDWGGMFALAANRLHFSDVILVTTETEKMTFIHELIGVSEIEIRECLTENKDVVIGIKQDAQNAEDELDCYRQLAARSNKVLILQTNMEVQRITGLLGFTTARELCNIYSDGIRSKIIAFER